MSALELRSVALVGGGRERTVEVTRHAYDRLVQRRPELGERAPAEVFRMIGREVEAALAGGRAANHKPQAFLLYGEKRKQLPAGQRFVEGEEGRGYVVKRDAETDVVVTALVRAWAWG